MWHFWRRPPLAVALAAHWAVNTAVVALAAVVMAVVALVAVVALAASATGAYC